MRSVILEIWCVPRKSNHATLFDSINGVLEIFFKRKKKRKKILLTIHFFFPSWHIYWIQQELEKHVPKRNLEKCSCLWVFQPWLEPGSSRSHKCEWVSPWAFQTRFTVLFCYTLLLSKVLTPSLLRYSFRQEGSTYIKSKINEDWDGECVLASGYWHCQTLVWNLSGKCLQKERESI